MIGQKLEGMRFRKGFVSNNKGPPPAHLPYPRREFR